MPQSQGTSMAVYRRDEQITPAMVTPAYIREAARSIVTASQSVEMVRSGQVYVPSVRRAVKEVGEKKIAAYIKMELIQLNVLLNMARPMSEQMIEMAVPLILKHLTEEDVEPNLADLKIIFDRARTGFYGQYYGGIGYSDIIGWIDRYILEEKLPAIHAWHNERYRNDDHYGRVCDRNSHADLEVKKMIIQRLANDTEKS